MIKVMTKKNYDDFNNKRKSSYTNQNSAKEKRKKIVITGDSMLNGIRERGYRSNNKSKYRIFRVVQVKLF